MGKYVNLTLTREEAYRVLDFLQSGRTDTLNLEGATKPVSKSLEMSTSTKVPPTPGKKVSMPAFGRTKEQIDNFVEAQEEKAEAKQLVAEKKQEKVAVVASQKAEVEAIKSGIEVPKTTLPNVKPWEL